MYQWSVSFALDCKLEKFENGDFTLQTHQMFSVHTTPDKFENATINGHVWICA